MTIKGQSGIYMLPAVFAACAIAGCAISTSKVSNAATSPVPRERIINSAYQTPESGDAHVIIKRDSGIWSAGCDFRVRVQGTLLATLWPAERLDLYLKPGTYILGASEGCGHTAVIEIEAQVAAGDLRTYRLELDGELGENRTIRFVPTTND